MEKLVDIFWEVIYAFIAIGVGYMWKLIREVIENKKPGDNASDVFEDIVDEVKEDFGNGDV